MVSSSSVNPLADEFPEPVNSCEHLPQLRSLPASSNKPCTHCPATESRDGGAWEQERLCGTAVLEPWQKAFVPKCFCVLCAPTLPPVLDFDADVPVMLQFVIQKL